MSARKQADAIEVAWGDESGPVERVKPRRKSKKPTDNIPIEPMTFLPKVPTSWPKNLDEKLLYIADRYVNHGDSHLFWGVNLALKKDRSKIARDARESLSLNTEALAGFAFFREMEPLIESNDRLKWLRDIVADSLAKRWKQQTKTHRSGKKQSIRRRGSDHVALVEKMRREAPDHKTIASLANALEIDRKTVKTYAKENNIEISRRYKKR